MSPARAHASHALLTHSPHAVSALTVYISQNLLRYLTDEARDKTPDAPFNAAEWRCDVVHDAPVQTTDCDCAVFVCAIAERLSAGRAVTFTQDDVSDMRRRMLSALYNNRVD